MVACYAKTLILVPGCAKLGHRVCEALPMSARPTCARVAGPCAPASPSRVAAVTDEAPHPFGLAVPGLGAG